MRPKYTDAQVKIFVDMWHQGFTASEIADRLGGSINSIRQFACRYREQYGLAKREGGNTPPRKDFDKLWS